LTAKDHSHTRGSGRKGWGRTRRGGTSYSPGAGEGDFRGKKLLGGYPAATAKLTPKRVEGRKEKGGSKKKRGEHRWEGVTSLSKSPFLREVKESDPEVLTCDGRSGYWGGKFQWENDHSRFLVTAPYGQSRRVEREKKEMN